jgi:hypothetical protein
MLYLPLCVDYSADISEEHVSIFIYEMSRLTITQSVIGYQIVVTQAHRKEELSSSLYR